MALRYMALPFIGDIPTKESKFYLGYRLVARSSWPCDTVWSVYPAKNGGAYIFLSRKWVCKRFDCYSRTV